MMKMSSIPWNRLELKVNLQGCNKYKTINPQKRTISAFLDNKEETGRSPSNDASPYRWLLGEFLLGHLPPEAYFTPLPGH